MRPDDTVDDSALESTTISEERLPDDGAGGVPSGGATTASENPPTTVVPVTLHPAYGNDKLPPSGDRFIPLRVHARGGLGEVFVARDVELGREVALKVIQERYSGDPKNRTRFVREAEITGNLEHPGIVPVYGFGHAADGCPFYAMRLIRGDSLETAILDFQAQTLSHRDPGQRTRALVEIIGHFQDACRAVGYAHAKGVLHRDLKPSNIMLGEHGETLVVDWGLAKTFGADEIQSSVIEPGTVVMAGTDSDLTLPGSRVGTPAYMSPEQAAGRVDELAPASDIYNLGATLYHLLAGRPPFEREPAAILLMKVQRGDFPPPHEVARWSVPPALEAICLKAMALRPEKRYKTPGDLADDIDGWLADEPVAAYAEPTTARLARWARRHRTWVLSGAVVATVLMIVLSVAIGLVHSAWQREQGVRREAESLANILQFDQGLSLCEQGWTGRGMLRLARALAMSPKGNDPIRRAILDNLAAWTSSLSPLRDVLSMHGGLRGLEIAKDGKTFVVGSDSSREGHFEGEVRLWSSVTRQPTGPALAHPGRILSIAYHPDGNLVLTGSDDNFARIWNAKTGELVGTPIPHPSSVVAVAISHDGKAMLTVSGKVVRLWNIARRTEIKPALEHPVDVLTARFSPNDEVVASGSRDNSVTLWNVESHKAVGSVLRHQSPVRCMAFTPDGGILVTGTLEGFVRFWDTSTRERMLTASMHRAEVCCLAISPDGKTVLSGGEDNTARLWNASNGQSVGIPMEHLSTVTAVAFSPDGRSFITGSLDRTVRFWDMPAQRGPLPPTLPGDALRVAATEGKFVVAGRGPARVLDSETLKPIGKDFPTTGEVTAVAWSRDGNTVVTGDADGVAQAWDARTRMPIGEPLALEESVTAVAFRPDGDAFLAGCDNCPAVLWNFRAGRPIDPPLPHRGGPAAFAFHPDGRSLVAADGDRAMIWEVANGALVEHDPRELIGHHGDIQCAVYSPDGRLIATGGEGNTIRLWDSVNGQMLGSPMLHDATVISLAFSPDGRTLVSGSIDRNARFWDVATNRPIGPPHRHPGRVFSVAFNPTGKSVYTACGDPTVRLWPTPPYLVDDASLIALWIEVLTGLEQQGEVASALFFPLHATAWHDRLRQLVEKGGSPFQQGR